VLSKIGADVTLLIKTVVITSIYTKFYIYSCSTLFVVNVKQKAGCYHFTLCKIQRCSNCTNFQCPLLKGCKSLSLQKLARPVDW